MIATGFRRLAMAVLIVSVFAFCACSKEKEAQKAGKEAQPAAQQAAEAIRDFGKKPLDKARAVQNLGDERTRAIDEAAGNQTRQ